MWLQLSDIGGYLRMCDNTDVRGGLLVAISLLFLTDLAIILNIPVLRQILGFFFLTILPGFLILRILKLDRIGTAEKFVLSVGISISFLLFFGLFLNSLLFNLGYNTPLSTAAILISFNLTFVAFGIIGYRINKTPTTFLPTVNLTTSEKAFLIVPILFPAISVFGMYVMNTTNNNIFLMFLYLLIPAYVVFISVFNQKFPERLYPGVTFLIGLSLLLSMALRSNHIIGSDTHTEYWFFQTTLSDLHWELFGHTTLDACLSISLLPTICQSILNVDSELLFKVLYPLIYSISPVIIYIISKKYVGAFYAFLASCFFMFQHSFLFTTMNARTCTAVIFFALVMMLTFNDELHPLGKKNLIILFMASCMVSHYSTTYIFLFITFVTFIGVELMSKRYAVKKVMSSTIVILFFSMIFFWYSQVTETAFSAGVDFVSNTITNLNRFFIEESRGGGVSAMFGAGIEKKGTPHKVEFVFTWISFAFIGTGLITLICKYKEMSFRELNFKRPSFLKGKFEVTYSVVAFACVILLSAMVLFPFVSVGYGMQRLYAMAITILSVFFVIGGVVMAKCLNKLLAVCRWKTLANNVSQVQAYMVILLVLIPYFFSVTGVMYNIFGVPRAITLNSEGEQYGTMYIHDQESCCAKWLKNTTDETSRIYADFFGTARLKSQGMIRSPKYPRLFIEEGRPIKKGYIYLRYTGVVDGKLLEWGGKWHNMTEYEGFFGDYYKVYANGGSEVYKCSR